MLPDSRSRVDCRGQKAEVVDCAQSCSGVVKNPACQLTKLRSNNSEWMRKQRLFCGSVVENLENGKFAS